MRVRLWIISGTFALAYLVAFWIGGNALLVIPIVHNAKTIGQRFLANLLCFVYGTITAWMAWQIYVRLHRNQYEYRSSGKIVSGEPALQIEIVPPFSVSGDEG